MRKRQAKKVFRRWHEGHTYRSATLYAAHYAHGRSARRPALSFIRWARRTRLSWDSLDLVMWESMTRMAFGS